MRLLRQYKIILFVIFLVSCSDIDSQFSGGAKENPSSYEVDNPEFSAQQGIPVTTPSFGGVDAGSIGGIGGVDGTTGGVDAGGIGGVGGAEGIPTFDTFVGSETTSVAKPVDIIFVFDESGSMSQEMVRLQQNLNRFINEMSSKLTDFKIYFIAQNPPFNSSTHDPSKFVHINHRVLSFDALAILAKLLLGKIPNPVPFRNATKQVVVITDDNARRTINTPVISPTDLDRLSASIDADQFIGLMNSHLPEIKSLAINGLIGLNTSVRTSWCSIARVGADYQKLAAMEKYKGVMLDLCKEDWSSLLTQLAVSIQESVFKNEFVLSRNIDFSKPVQVVVDGLILDPKEYLLTNNSLSFVTRIPGQNSQIRIDYSYIP